PNLAHLHPRRFHDIDTTFWTPAEISRRGIGVATADEYRPRWLQPSPHLATSAFSSIVRPSPIQWRGEIEVSKSSSIQAPVAYFPGWRVRMDGKAVPVRPSAENGLLRFEVPAGKHRVEADWTEPVPCLIGDAVTVCALGLMMILFRSRVRNFVGRMAW